MIDITLIRDASDIVKDSQKKRGMDESVVDQLLKLDKDWRSLKKEVDELRSRRNKISEDINIARKSGRNADSLLKQAKEIPQELARLEAVMKERETERNRLWKEIPNIIDKSVPVGDASRNKVIETHGKISKPKFLHKDHADILESLDLLDTQTASNVSASRFYYLKGNLVKLNYAIISFALNFLAKRHFTLIQPPFMLRREVLEGALPLGIFDEMIYKIEGEDLYLIGTAEHAINAYYYNKEIQSNEMPIRFAGISTSFRKEAGAHGKDTKGIFRVHQFEKVEQFVFCRPEQAWKEFELILDNSRQLLKALEIPFRFVVLSSQEMGRVPVKTIDFEGYFPSQKAYCELGSCSNCTDYQARRSNIRFSDGREMKFVNTLNNTAIATERMIACLIDNNQQPDGSIKIPKALWPYTKFKEIKAKKSVKKEKKSNNKVKKRE
ncbi:serine--tRNA ligase [Candidatus Pacearchaeota archaeon]|nr:serine--tRNA ligase [Candidatus Pacearchaeota archaeon]